MKAFLLGICLVWSLCVAAQSLGKGTIAVMVTNQQQHNIDGATVELLGAKDSALIKVVLSDKEGLALFDDIAEGSYLIRIVTTGYLSAYTPTFTITATQPDVKLPTVTLTATAAKLKDVEVSTKKPFIQKLNDRIVVNVKSSIISAGK